jgi:hypothetical protein
MRRHRLLIGFDLQSSACIFDPAALVLGRLRTKFVVMLGRKAV